MGTWKRSAKSEILVSSESAVQSRFRHSDIFSINEDHSNMVKFAEDDSNYQGVLSYLYELSETLSPRQSVEEINPPSLMKDDAEKPKSSKHPSKWRFSLRKLGSERRKIRMSPARASCSGRCSYLRIFVPQAGTLIHFPRRL